MSETSMERFPSVPVDDDPVILRRVLDQMPAMVSYWDAECRNVFANGVFTSWLGTDQVDLVGMHISDVLGPERYAESLPFIEAVLAGERQDLDRTLVVGEGRERHTHACFVPHVVDGLTVGVIVLTTDVTARVEAEQALQKSVALYRALARSMPKSFVLVFDADLRFVIADGPALETFSMSRSEVEGRTIFEIMSDRAEDLAVHYRAALAGESRTWERIVGRRVISLSASPLRDDDGMIFAGLVVGTDTTDEHQRAAADRALQGIATATAQGQSLDAVLDMATESMLDLFGAAYAGLARYDNQGRVEMIRMQPTLSRTDGSPFDFGDGSAVAAVRTSGRPVVLRFDTRSAGLGRALFDAGIRASAAAPIHVNGRIWGALALAVTDGGALGEAELARLVGFTDAVATSISSAAAWLELSEQAVRDSLTGLPNRRAFDEELDRVCRSAKRSATPVSLVILDIDHFKDVNDTHGHPVGDVVLARAAARMATAVRSGEFLGRLGGEEFVLILPGATEAAAERAAERLRAAVGVSVDGVPHVTASAGVCTRDGNALVADDLVRVADRCLYEAKRAGRDTLRTSGRTPGEQRSTARADDRVPG